MKRFSNFECRGTEESKAAEVSRAHPLFIRGSDDSRDEVTIRGVSTGTAHRTLFLLATGVHSVLNDYKTISYNGPWVP